MRGDEVLRIHRHLFGGRSFNVADPVAIRAETIRHHDLGTLLAILDDFKNGLTPQTATSADVGQQEQAPSEQPSQVPAIKIDRATEEIPHQTLWLHRDHREIRTVIRMRRRQARGAPGTFAVFECGKLTVNSY